MIRQLVRYGFLAIFLLIAGFMPAVFAESEILVLYRSDIPLYRDVARQLQEKTHPKVIPCPIESLSVSFIESHAPIAMITLGDAGLKRALLMSLNIPIIATLVDAVPTDERVHLLSTNQPINRQLALLRRLFPELKRVWIPSIEPRYAPSAEMLRGVPSGNLMVDSQSLRTPRDLPEALRSITPGNTAIILSPDPALMNEATLQSIFLASFQKQCPVIGFSEGLVKKGAALAFTLTPENLAAELFDFAVSLTEVRSKGNRAFTGWQLILNRTILEKLGLPIPADLAATARKIF